MAYKLTPSFGVLENYLYKKHKNMGDNGISLQVGGGINDPDERLQLFADLIYVLKANDGFTVERFASNKGYDINRFLVITPFIFFISKLNSKLLCLTQNPTDIYMKRLAFFIEAFKFGDHSAGIGIVSINKFD